MRSAVLALLATIAGLALLGAGIYGIATGGDDEDDSPSTSTSVSVPTSDASSTERDQCAALGKRDPRLPHLDGLEMKAVGRETGTATAKLICSGNTLVLIWEMKGLREKETSKYQAYLYNSRTDSEHVGTVIGSDGDATGSVTVGTDKDTTKYDSLVFSHLLFGEFEERPKRIVFRAPL